METEEKAKRYDETIKRAKGVIEQNPLMEYLKKGIEYIFPELKESEDEKIRKSIIENLKGNMCRTDGDYDLLNKQITWLEKQGEQKQDPCDNCKDVRLNCHNFPCVKKKAFKQGKSVLEVINEEKVDNQNCVKTVDKVEPKFHEGEWITNGDYTGKIVEVKPLYYILQSQDGNIVDDTISHVDKQFHSFTIKDAKAGDVLVIQETDFAYESIFIFNKIENNHIIQYLHYFITDKGEEVCKVKSVRGFIGFVGENVHPATKEQREQLKKAMTDAGYAFDFAKKKLKKVEHNPAWSEEDEINLEKAIWYVENPASMVVKDSMLVEWLKSLKNRVGCEVNCTTTKEWSVEDMSKIQRICKYLDEAKKYYADITEVRECIEWLKFLRPQYIWQPSDEQLEALKEATNIVGCKYKSYLNSLYSDLKKLK